MKSFRVVANVIRGRYGTIDNVKSDGSYDEEPEMGDEEVEILRGYTVEVYDEYGAGIDEAFYGVATKDDGTDDREEVIKEICADFPPTEYQNHNW